MSTHGLIIGKFLPPHSGHLYLIEEGAKQVDELTVLVLASQTQFPTMNQRVEWLRAIFPAASTNITITGCWDDAYDDYEDENVWADHQQIMETCIGNRKVDFLFSSEHYGYELADKFHAKHIPVDIPRKTYPISGTAVRDNPAENWNQMHPVIRKDLGVRIVIVGGESTGTTTLSKDLQNHYKTMYPNVGWVEEYGRTYTYEKIEEAQRINPDATVYDLVWDEDDFAAIGLAQTESEEKYFSGDDSSPLLICDTDAFATKIWEHRYLENGARFKERDWADKLPPRTLYIITDHHGVDFDQDGIRDGEHIREEMTQWFKDDLTREGKPWVILRGTREERIHQATRIIDKIMKHKLNWHL